MSEYQYYEWQTIDRPLTEAEQAAVNRLSSHIDVTPSQAIMTYDWGDFKHDPRQVLARYFDAHFYWANWGSRRLMFRFPAGADLQALQPYCLPDYITLDQVEDAQVLEIALDEDEGFEEWDAVEDGLSPYVRLRNDILQSDCRLLYLAWLKAISLAKDDPDLEDEREPPVPAGLNRLNAALNRFMRLVGVDRHLVQAAAAASGEMQTVGDSELRQVVAQLPRPECDEILLRLAKGEAGLSTVVNQKIQPFLRRPPSQAASPQTVGQLFEIAKKLKQETHRRSAETARQKNIAEMKALAAREVQAWQEVDGLLQSGKTAAIYDQATALLDKLKQLSKFQDTSDTFQSRLLALVEKYSTRHSLIRRWKERGWV